MKNIIIFGTGKFAEEAYLYYSKEKEFNIIAFADNDRKKHNTKFYNINVISAEEISLYSYYRIMIASSFDKEIFEQLINLGIVNKKIKKLNLNDVKRNFSEKNKLFLAETLMLDICREFYNKDIEYHIDHGTLLGIIRDKSLLPWDIDVDFAILEEEKNKTLEVLNCFLKNYISKYCKNNNWKCSLHKCIMKVDNVQKELPMVIKIFNDIDEAISNGFFIDIEIKYLHNNKLFWMVGSRKLSSDFNSCFPSKVINYENNKIRIPNDEKAYLKSLYGNWKKVVKNWAYENYNNIR